MGYSEIYLGLRKASLNARFVRLFDYGKSDTSVRLQDIYNTNESVVPLIIYLEIMGYQNMSAHQVNSKIPNYRKNGSKPMTILPFSSSLGGVALFAPFNR